MNTIKWGINIIVTVVVASYQWGEYRTERQWTDDNPTWLIVKNILLFIAKAIIPLLIILCAGGGETDSIEHYEPRY